jgi:hypothetical protein
MENMKMSPYKNHPIYGVAIRRSGKRWHARGLVFGTDENSTIKIKRLESTDLTFTTKKAAEEQALNLCRAWIDEQSSKSTSKFVKASDQSIKVG